MKDKIVRFSVSIAHLICSDCLKFFAFIITVKMVFKLASILVIMYMVQIRFVFTSQKYEFISDCIFYSRSTTPGFDNVTFICSGDQNKNVFLINKVRCSNLKHDYFIYQYPYQYQHQQQPYYDSEFTWPGTIDFKDCRFAKMPKINFFETFPNMHTFIISNVDLETFPTETFRKATNIKILIANNNRFKEVPALGFVNADKLRILDFSGNIIERIDSLAFFGLNNLETLDLAQNNLTKFDDGVFKLPNLQLLNLSHNQISGLNSNVLTMPSLLELNLAENNLTSFDGHIFNQLSKLKKLNLSFNPIAELKPETFAFLIDLKHLSLRRTNISSIRMGTFSHQHKLTSLDLSENSMKTLDFKLLYPVLPDLISLRLSNNQLSELKNFRNSLFPQLVLLDIQRNNFNCSYLEYLMESVNWEDLELSINPYLVDFSKPNIRGINCGESNQNSTMKINEKEVYVKTQRNLSHRKSDQMLNDSISTVVLQTIMCFIMFAFLILFVILNRAKIYNRLGRLTVMNSSNEMPSQNVEYSNTELLMK